MAQCPLCEAQVTDDFGLMECSGCGAQLIVHMDGRVEYSGAKEVGAGSDVEGDLSSAIEDHVGEEEDLPEFLSPQMPDDDTVVSAEPVESAPAPDFLNELADEDKTTVLTPDPPPAQDSPDLSDIARFGNSAGSLAGDGSLRYNLVVSGIDTSDVREAFREAITDRKLVWDIDKILRSVRNGEVRLTNVPAAKAFIVVSRLRILPVQVRWEQYAVAQS